MSTGVGLAVGVGALLLVVYLNRQSEQATAMQVSRVTNSKNSAGLGIGDVVAAGGVAAATYAGGPLAGLKAFGGSGIRL